MNWSLLGEPKKRNAQNFHTLENLNICKQDTENRRFLCQSSSHYVFNSNLQQRMIRTFRKSVDVFTSHFVHTFDV